MFRRAAVLAALAFLSPPAAHRGGGPQARAQDRPLSSRLLQLRELLRPQEKRQARHRQGRPLSAGVLLQR